MSYKSNADNITNDDLNIIIDKGISKRTLVGHHIESYNNFMSQGIKQIVTQLFKIEINVPNERDITDEDKEIETVSVTGTFTDVKVTKPTTRNTTGEASILYPNQARKQKKNYSSPIYMDLDIEAIAYLKNGTTKVRNQSIKNFKVASIPTMVGSKICHTYGLPKTVKKNIEEDPQDPGGYFIIKGGEWCVSMLETRLYNSPHIFRNVGHKKEISRLEFLSKPGDAFENSSSIIIKYVNNGNIYIMYNSNDDIKIDIPFYIIFRLLGMISDQEICDNIIYGYSNNKVKNVVSDHMFHVLKRALTVNDVNFGDAYNILDQGKLLALFAQKTSILFHEKLGKSSVLSHEIDEKTLKYMTYNIINILDKWTLPHIGTTPDTRHTKLRYLGHLIHKMLLVEYQIVESTDRDSQKNKRINAAGISLAKAFKQHFNLTIIMPAKSKFRKDLKNMPFSQVNFAQSFTSAIDTPALEKALIQAIVTGDKDLMIKNRAVANRMSSEVLHRKNFLNVISTLRVIRTANTSSAKQDKRAEEMRRVHPSYIGYICPIQSSDGGDHVGMVKQLSLSAFISNSSSSTLLKQVIMGDESVMLLNMLFPNMIHDMNLTKIFVNGDWVGCVKNGPLLWYRYRDIRRGVFWKNFDDTPDKVSVGMPGIDPYTSIFWDTDANEIHFWVDVGRMLRPVLIIRNNGELDPYGRKVIGSAYDPIKNTGFIQDIMLTKKHIEELKLGVITIEDLHGIIDYISPEEMENNCLAYNLKLVKQYMKQSENPESVLHQYNYCEIPQGLLGIPALTCPFTQNNQPQRITFQTNQTKQTNSWYTLNWPHRVDKHAFMQFYSEIPVIRTLANKYVYPNGVNAIVAIMCYGGYNQEDSLFYNVGSAQRGFTKGSHYGFIQAELDKDEYFGTPNIDITIGTKESYANYGKLVKGFPEPGTIITDKDIIIGRYTKLPENNGRYTYKDTSIVYPNRETAVIEKIIPGRDQEGIAHVRVKHSSVRELGIGDKFCLLPDSEVLTNNGWKKMNNIKIGDVVCTLNPINNVIEYQIVNEKYEFEHNGPLYNLNYENNTIGNQSLGIVSTFNHKMYVKIDNTFKLIEVSKLDDINVGFKITGDNIIEDDHMIELYYKNNRLRDILSFDVWLKILGAFIITGEIIFNESIYYMTYIAEFQCSVNIIDYYKRYVSTDINQLVINNDIIYELSEFSIEINDRFLPKYCLNMSHRHSKILLDTIIDCSWYNVHQLYKAIKISSIKLVNDIILLSLRAGMNASYKDTGDYYIVYIYNVDIIDVHINLADTIQYNGIVQCIQVPNHIFMMRQNENSIPLWTGNSSRHGQKGVTGNGYNHSDMPFTTNGIVPDLVLNPHAIPSRMTIGQLLEGYSGKLAVIKGMLSDATIFKDTDLEAIGDELESLGWDRYSNERMWCGMTGDWINTMIFITPTYYQRLLKFVVEEVYSVSTGPTCVLTRQPLDGKANKGGLRIGEMEKDVIISHGSGHFIMEKYRGDSDGFDIYVCRTCGGCPVVNETKNIIMCNICQSMGLDPQVYKVKSTWASKLFFQEMESMGVGIKLELEPFTYEQHI